MSSVVLDASALLALLNQEKGYQLVEEQLPRAIMSCVNLCEAATVLVQNGMSPSEIKDIFQSLIPDPIDFDAAQTYVAAILRSDTKQYGLSFGDRACLGLAKIHNLPVLTADKIWAKLSIGVKIMLIR